MLLHPFLPQQKLFKAYDIRGDVRLFTDDFLWALATSFAKLFHHHHATDIVIGYDVRLQSAYIANFLATLFEQQGLSVRWLGQVTTPMMALMAHQTTGHGLMVTASHCDKDINGVKWLVAGESPSSADIEELYFSLADAYTHLPPTAFITQLQTNLAKRQADLASQHVFKAYQTAVTAAVNKINEQYTTLPTVDLPHQALRKPYRLVIDCMSGATSRFAESLFAGLGYECLMLNAEPNGNFPAGNPDPAEAGRLTELCQTVQRYNADVGLAFDGDGDRLMVVTRQGNVVSPDHLLYLLATLALDELPKPQKIADHNPRLGTPPEVIFDVKCSHHLPRLISGRGATPVMEKTGSSLMRKSLQNKSRHSIFAGELSGHFLFNDGYFVLHDDAMYAAVRLLNWLQHQPQDLTELLASLPLSVSTADMYLPVASSEDGKKLVDKLVKLSKKPFKAMKKAFSVDHINTIDGLRLDFSHGFGIVRKSNTGNYLTVRFVGDTLADLYQVQAIFVGLCRHVDSNLADQVANIQPVSLA